MNGRKICLAAATLMLLGACSSGSKEKRTLTVSIPPEKTLVEQIVGDRFDVECMMTSNANPESFEPSMGSLVALESSDVYFTTGTLDFERNLVTHLKSSGSDVTVADLSEEIDLLYGTHDDHDHEDGPHGHESADPHIWSSVRNLKTMAANVEKTLSRLDPDGAAVYRDNLKAVEHRLDSIDLATASRLDTVTVRSFMVWHPSLSYFARDYGLEQLTVGSHGKEQSVRQLHEKLSAAGIRNVRVFFFQEEFDSRQAEAVNGMLGVKAVAINPMNADYETEITKVADAFCRQ